jgi:hypothetical protein
MKEWMVLAAEIMLLISMLAVLASVIWWMLANQEKVAKWHINCPKDPRWANKGKIITFIFLFVTGLVFLIFALIGAMTK